MQNIVFFLLVATCLAGNGLNVRNQLLLMPYPQSVSAQYGSASSIALTSAVTMNLQSVCSSDPSCQEFMKFNFNHTITFPLQRQEGLKDFTISMFPEFDIPHITPSIAATISKIEIDFTKTTAAEVFPKLQIGNDESYTLTVSTSGVVIKAATAYGARHALETLIQLIRISNGKFVISQLPITITDKPRFQWRGLMIDPSRNVISRETVMRVVDTLASLKMNILHIHLVDAQTFMFESKDYPNLSLKGAYDQENVFTHTFISQLIDYAQKRGVIVYPELDMPAHAASWSLGYPGVAASCFDVAATYRYGENIVTLNPTNENTFPIISSVLKDMQASFKSDYVHIGGDEVSSICWKNCKEAQAIKDWMNLKGFATYGEVEQYFNKYSQEQVISTGAKPVCWEEVYTNGNADLRSVIQVWNDISVLKRAVDDGYKAIFSAGFYVDMQMPLCYNDDPDTCSHPYHMWVWTNRDFYKNDPVKSFTDAEKANVLGGEGASWGESTDDQNIFDRVFQRYSAIAERLWSSEKLTDPESHEVRADYYRCLALRRSISNGAGPLYHQFCDIPK